MTYSLLTTPGGHAYLSGSGSTMPALVDGLQAIALQADTAAADIAQQIADETVEGIDYWRGNLTGNGGADLNTTYGGVTPAESTGRVTYSVYWLAGQVDEIANMPPTTAFYNGTVEVFSSSNGRQFLQIVKFMVSGETWMRSMTFTSGDVWTYEEWVRQTPEPGSGELAARRDMMLDAFTARRGGTIGTGSLPAVALRFDHHLDDFESTVLPLLRERSLPWAQAINPENLGTGDDNATYAEIQGWCLDDGGEIWNHGGDHQDASGPTDITEQIVGSLEALQAGMPRLAIEGWAPPGLGEGGYDGYTPMNEPSRQSDTLAGRLSLGYHAAVSGYLPNGLYRPLDGKVRAGQQHATIDQATPATVSGYLNGVPDGHGLVLMLHPNYVGDVGYISLADLTAILDDIAARRDAGELLVLSHTGLVGADATHARRDDLLSVHSATGDLTEVAAINRRGYLTGGMRELTAEVTLAAPGTVTTTVAESVKAHSLGAGVHTVRHVAVIPTDLLTVPIEVTGADSVADAHAYIV